MLHTCWWEDKELVCSIRRVWVDAGIDVELGSVLSFAWLSTRVETQTTVRRVLELCPRPHRCAHAVGYLLSQRAEMAIARRGKKIGVVVGVCARARSVCVCVRLPVCARVVRKEHILCLLASKWEPAPPCAFVALAGVGRSGLPSEREHQASGCRHGVCPLHC
jgi:hypothetical protein